MILKFSDDDLNPSVNCNTKVTGTAPYTEVSREYSNISSPYNGPTHAKVDSDVYKYCPMENSYLPVSRFTEVGKSGKYGTYDGLSSVSNKYLSWYGNKPTPTPYLIDLMGASCGGSYYDGDFQEMIDAILMQEGYCFISKRPLLEDNLRFVVLQGSNKIVVVCADLPPHIISENLIEHRKQFIPEYFRVESKIIKEGAQLPQRKRSTDAAYDIFSCEDTVIPAGGFKAVDTGVIVCPPPNCYFTIENRSSFSAKGIVPFRGIIDANSSGELTITLQNNSKEDFTISSGDKIALIVVMKQYNADFIAAESFSPTKSGI